MSIADLTLVDEFLVLISTATVLTFVHLLLNIAIRRRIPLNASHPSAAFDQGVAVLIPMRDEELNAADVVRTVLAQEAVPGLQLIVCDDNSTDATADLVATAAGGDARVTLLKGQPLPNGWLGKPWACKQLRDAAGNVDILVFIDADVRLHPRAIASSIAVLRRHRLSLLSPFPRQLYRGFWLSLFQPMLQWSILAMLPLRVMELRARWRVFTNLAAANGQFLVIDAADYDRADGHTSVKSQVVEDVMLARAIKRAGGKVTLTPAPEVASCRMYTNNSEFVIGYTKSMWAAFGGPLGGLGVTATFLLQYVLPWIGVVANPIGSVTFAACAAAIAAGMAGRIAAALTARDALWPALLHPLSIFVFAWLMVESLRRKASGTLQWKDRAIS